MATEFGTDESGLFFSDGRYAMGLSECDDGLYLSSIDEQIGVTLDREAVDALHASLTAWRAGKPLCDSGISR